MLTFRIPQKAGWDRRHCLKAFVQPCSCLHVPRTSVTINPYARIFDNLRLTRKTVRLSGVRSFGCACLAVSNFWISGRSHVWHALIIAESAGIKFCGLISSFGCDGIPSFINMSPVISWPSLKGSLKGPRAKILKLLRSLAGATIAPNLRAPVGSVNWYTQVAFFFLTSRPEISLGIKTSFWHNPMQRTIFFTPSDWFVKTASSLSLLQVSIVGLGYSMMLSYKSWQNVTKPGVAELSVRSCWDECLDNSFLMRLQSQQTWLGA